MNKIQIIAGWLLTFLVCLPTVNATEDTLSRFKDEGKKTFTFVQEFKYKHIKYKDTILTNYLDAPLDVNNGPDRQLVRFLSALRADDFAWWQSHWSVATRDDWENKVELNKARRMFNYWKRYVHPESTTELIDFVTMNSRVMIGFNVKDKETNYFLVPFVLENSRWRVDEPFMRSDLYRKLRAELVGS